MNQISKTLLSSRRARRVILLLVDLICFVIATALILGIYPSSAMRLTTRIKLIHGLILAGAVFLFRFILRIYSQSWRYANESAYLSFILADSLGGLLYYGISSQFMVWKISFIHALAIVSAELLFTLSVRFLYQWKRARERGGGLTLFKKRKDPSARIKTRIAIVGASDMGVPLAEDLLRQHDAMYQPVCFFDNNPEKIGGYIGSLKIYAEDEYIPDVAQKLGIETFVIAVPSEDPAYIQSLFEKYKQTGRQVLIYDFPHNNLGGEGKTRSIREINIEDLLPRELVTGLDDTVTNYYRDQTILVTGAGGSIGSELCRQLCQLKPKLLIMLDINENGVYDLCQELKLLHKGAVRLQIEIASVRDSQKMDEVVGRYKPSIVFHAAAHKHVPLMEHNPEEAIKNNVMGTYNMASAAEKHGVKRFLLISTDKAVNPTNIMGASKRLCEMIVQSRTGSATDFVAVRFGNVLNSNGSVIPIFKRQIAAGGPVTITDNEVIRFFMMIPEAAQLVLQSACKASNGEIYVLNMGRPVKILDLAKNMIRLSGFEPYVDIDIVEIGLRPGEKLYEELLVHADSTRQTEDRHIFIELEQGLERADIDNKIEELKQALSPDSRLSVKELLMALVPTYHEAEEVNKYARDAAEMKEAQDFPQTQLNEIAF